MFYKKDILGGIAKFTKKAPAPVSVFNKFTGLQPATLFKKRLQHRCFPVNFANFLVTSF